MTNEEILLHRRFAFGIAYRMLGSATDAEDVVQDCFVRLQRAAPREEGAVRGYIAKTTTRACIYRLRAEGARRRREERTVLPDPLPAQLAAGPHDPMELAQSLSFAFLLLLERLTPLERAAFLLRDVFDFEFAELAAVLERSETSCRQLLSRARRHMSAGRPRFRPDAGRVAALAAAFAHACQTGDLPDLLTLLARDVTLHADGGPGRTTYGRVRALSKPLRGATRVARFLMTVQRQAPNAEASIEPVNNVPALVARVGGRAIGVLSFEVVGSRIRRIFIVNDPAKLARLNTH